MLEKYFFGPPGSYVIGHGKIFDEAGQELGILGGEDNIHGGGYHPAAKDAIPMHHGYGGFGQVTPGQAKFDIHFAHVFEPGR